MSVGKIHCSYSPLNIENQIQFKNTKLSNKRYNSTPKFNENSESIEFIIIEFGFLCTRELKRRNQALGIGCFY